MRCRVPEERRRLVRLLIARVQLKDRRLDIIEWQSAGGGTKSTPVGDQRNSHRPQNPAPLGPSGAAKSPEHVRALEWWSGGPPNLTIKSL
jgi:hypothetical protein